MILATCLDLQLKYPATILLTEDDRLGVQARTLNVAVAKCSDIKERLKGGQIDDEALVDQVTHFYHTLINCVFSQLEDGWVEVKTAQGSQKLKLPSWSSKLPSGS